MSLSLFSFKEQARRNEPNQPFLRERWSLIEQIRALHNFVSSLKARIVLRGSEECMMHTISQVPFCNFLLAQAHFKIFNTCCWGSPRNATDAVVESLTGSLRAATIEKILSQKGKAFSLWSSGNFRAVLAEYKACGLVLLYNHRFPFRYYEGF